MGRTEGFLLFNTINKEVVIIAIMEEEINKNLETNNLLTEEEFGEMQRKVKLEISHFIVVRYI